jgi:hypothetical protein
MAVTANSLTQAKRLESSAALLGNSTSLPPPKYNYLTNPMKHCPP